MRKLAITLALLCAPLAAQTNSLTPVAVDGANQTRPVVFGRVFAQGEIALCPQPKVGGTAVAAGSWQATVKNRWPDTSVRFAVIALSMTVKTLANTPDAITFQSVAQGSAAGGGACDDAGGLTATQMANFSVGGGAGTWDATVVVAASGSTTVTTSAKTRLAVTDPGANTFPDCKNDYWTRGPVATQVIVQDCTSSMGADFGWSWNGSTMSSPVTGTSTTASLHPMFVLNFFPGISAIQAEMVLEDPWTTKLQDQSLSSITFKTSDAAGTLQTRLTTGALTMHPGQRWRKTFWVGTSPGTLRIDHGFSYLTSTKVFPNYDLTNTVTSVVTPDTTSVPADGVTSWASWTGGDKGNLGGTGGLYGLDQDFSSNAEGAPLQREDLLYLYSMSTCGTANSACAKAWQMLNAESGAIDTLLTGYNVTGLAGTWNNDGNIPYHLREGRATATGQQSTSNGFYCSAFASKDAVTNTAATTCGTDALGKALSKDAHSDDQWGGPGYWGGLSGITTVGTATGGGWAIGGCNHWQDWQTVPYLLTGDYYYLENSYQAASLCLNDSNPDPQNVAGGARFFGYMSPEGPVIRELAWGLLAVGRAGMLAPDGTVEATYYQAKVDSNLAVQEGFMGITGTSLTPTTLACNGASCTYNPIGANRWDWGRATANSLCFASGTCTIIPTAMHVVAPGACPTSLDNQPNVNYTQSHTFIQYWMYSYLNVALGLLRDMGYSHVTAVSNEMQKSLIERTLDSNYNPYLLAMYIEGGPKNGTTCGGSNISADPYYTTYTQVKTSVVASLQNQCTFNNFNNLNSLGTCGGNTSAIQNSNIPCGDHGYSLISRAAGSFLNEFAQTSTDSGTSATLTAANAWTWLSGRVPFFSTAVSNSQACSSYWPDLDSQVKYALAPRTASTGPVVSLSPSSINFGSINTGASSSPSSVTVSNVGSADLTFGAAAVTLSGTNAGDFAIGSDTCSSHTVAASGTCSFTVTFTPLAIGVRSASVHLANNAADSPQIMAVSGTGTTTGTPSITSASPNPATVGTSITIAGVNFGASQGLSTVTFNGTAATPTSWSATAIVAPVPTGASTGNLVVTVGGTPSNALAFTVQTTSVTRHGLGKGHVKP